LHLVQELTRATPQAAALNMTYAVKEIFFTLQGEGRNTGRAAVFCRFTGCNLWSGREDDRATAVCTFCDTDFVGTDGLGGGRFGSGCELARAIAGMWPSSSSGRRFVVLTGGEPLLQVDTELLEALHAEQFEIALETNGTIPVPFGVDWVCVSPKAGTALAVQAGNEIKLVFPQQDVDPATFESLSFDHFLLSPLDGPMAQENTRAAVAYCLQHTRWRLSLQTHKLLGIR
jgi:7-carboxy-7-deazaguanine synthase